MGQSLVRNYVHIVFSTKHREPFIFSPVETELYGYLGSICNNLECQTIIVGGHVDHVHILCMLSKKIALMVLPRETLRSPLAFFLASIFMRLEIGLSLSCPCTSIT